MSKRTIAIALVFVLAAAGVAYASLRGDLKAASSSCIADMLAQTTGSGETVIVVGTTGTKAGGGGFQTSVGATAGGYLPISSAIAGADVCIGALDQIMGQHGATGLIWVEVQSNDGTIGYFLVADGIGG